MNEPEHRFIWYLCKMYRKLPSDPFITEMDPVLKVWLYEHWLGDHRDDAELAKNHAYLLGSFWNAEAVKQMMNPNVHESSEEDYEESLRMVKDTNLQAMIAEPPPKQRRRRRATLKDNQQGQ